MLSEIPDSNAQARVLGALTENFPNEPHYWNHRGRHSNLILKESYHLAEEYLQNAIDLLNQNYSAANPLTSTTGIR